VKDVIGIKERGQNEGIVNLPAFMRVAIGGTKYLRTFEVEVEGAGRLVEV
jgi:hypothetical protein